MADRLSESLLSRLSEFVADRMGFYFPRERWPDLERGIRSVTREFQAGDAEACIQRLLSAPVTQSQVEILASHLTVGETYFFRERPSFQALEDGVFPDLIRKRRRDRRLRIWSAGCCTGEEPYSIAIVLRRLIADLKDWEITLLATDINPDFLKKAAAGVYREWSFRGSSADAKEKYFTKKPDGLFEILPEIKGMITFSYLNLAEDSYPSLLNQSNAMDLIFCRNVLIYFGAERARQVIEKFHRSLLDGGWLVVGSSETSHLLNSPFAPVNLPGATFFKKDIQGAPAGEPAAVSAESGPPVPGPPGEPTLRDLAQASAAAPVSAGYAEASALYEKGRYEDATQELLLLLAQQPGDSKWMALLARAYANQGKLTEAVGWCEKAVAADKLNPAGHVLHANILQEQGAIPEAMRALQCALYLDRNLVLAHFMLGSLARQRRQFKEAERHFHNARAILRTYPEEEALPEGDGITAGRLSEIIDAML